MAINRGPGGSGDASNAASNASAIATVKAQEAAESAASALSSANNAAISASSASASASSATASASAASGSASTASSASSTATTQAGIATTKASEASTSASNALTSETNAATSADLAEDWAIKTSGPVAGGEYSSKYHAGLASTSATSANDAKTSAEAARDATLAAYDQFDDRYLGTKTTDPTVDNDGDPLVAGSLYFNSVSGVMRLYTGSAWVAAYVSGVASSVAVTPAGNIASTNVQTALQELDGEKIATSAIGVTVQAFDADIPTVSASQAEMEAGTETALRSMSPLRVKQAITANAVSPTIASTAEAQAGTNNTNFLTPLRLREGFNASGTAPVYACRAWVNFNGTGTVAIRASGNVSSITDNGTGDYTVNFTTAMTDANYASCFTSGRGTGDTQGDIINVTDTQSSSFARVLIRNRSDTIVDQAQIFASFLR
jgi:hypothetical protein